MEGLYEDSCDILRSVSHTGSDGIARMEWQVTAEGVGCGLSEGNERSGWSKAPLYLQNRSGLRPIAHQQIDFDRTLFLPPEAEVRPGDRIAVHRFGKGAPSAAAVEFDVVGEPLCYATHQEIRLRRTGVS